MIDWATVQRRLGIAADGVAGPVTWGALLERIAGRAVPRRRALGTALADHAPDAGIDRTARRAAHFLAQTSVESGGFRWLEELGGAEYLARYDGRADLGNVRPGDGARFRGRGLIQLTGRANYATFGDRLGIDLIADPARAAEPDTAVRLALTFWTDRDLNRLADLGRIEAITRRINGGLNGIAERRTAYAVAIGVLG
jgi:putative chitinase